MGRKAVGTVLEENASKLLSIHGVAGIAEGECDGKPCIKVFVVKKEPETLRQIPSVLEGCNVIVEQSGKLRALNNSK